MMRPSTIVAFAFGPIGSAALGLITVPLIAWLVSQEDVGRYAMLQVSISFFPLLLSLGLDQAYVREYHDSGVKSGLWLACMLPGLMLLVLLIVSVLVARPAGLASILFGVQSVMLSLIAGGIFLVFFLVRFLALMVRMQERAWAFSASQILPKAGFLAVIGVGIWVGDGLGVTQLVVAQLVAGLAAVLLLAWVTRLDWSRPTPFQARQRYLGLLSYGLPLMVSGAAFWCMTSLDRIFLRVYGGFEELGLYAVATGIAGAAVMIQGIFSTVWAPMVYKREAQGGVKPEVIEILRDQMLAIVTIIFSLAGMCAWVIALILPEKYRGVQYILPACLVYPFFYVLGEVTGAGLGLARRSKQVMWAAFMALGVNVMMNSQLVPVFGAAGAASASAISFMALLLLRTEYSGRYWASLPRGRFYLLIALITGLAVGYALWGSSSPLMFFWLWGVLLFIGFFAFRREWRMLNTRLIAWGKDLHSSKNCG